MKITIVCDVLGEPNNGTSIAAYNLINTLKNKGHDVKVLCPDELKKGEPGYYVLPHLSFGVFNSYVKKNGVSLAKYDNETVDKACKDADIIHVMMPFSAGHMAAIYAFEHNIPLSAGFHVQAENITSHFFSMNNKGINAIAYKKLKKSVYQYCNSIHYPTKFIQEYVKKYGIKAPSEYVISNGVNQSVYYPHFVKKPKAYEDRFVILMSGRYSKEKNQQMLIKAVGRSKYNSKIQLIFAGDGPQKKNLFLLSEKMLVNRPLFTLCSREKLSEIINYSDLYVHTSKIEIEAISCLEAISCGLVPLISDSPRSATSKFALFEQSKFRFNKVKDLKNKIEYWIEHPQERHKARQIYIDFGKQFDFNKCMDQMEEMLIEVARKYEKNKN